jgi:hypothetical protein
MSFQLAHFCPSSHHSLYQRLRIVTKFEWPNQAIHRVLLVLLSFSRLSGYKSRQTWSSWCCDLRGLGNCGLESIMQTRLRPQHGRTKIWSSAPIADDSSTDQLEPLFSLLKTRGSGVSGRPGELFVVMWSITLNGEVIDSSYTLSASNRSTLRRSMCRAILSFDHLLH